jgi:hypothetical protein
MNIVILSATAHMDLNLESMRKLHIYAVEFEDSPNFYNVIKNKITGVIGFHSLEDLLKIVADAASY